VLTDSKQTTAVLSCSGKVPVLTAVLPAVLNLVLSSILVLYRYLQYTRSTKFSTTKSSTISTLLVLYPGALVPPEALNSVPLEYYSCTSRIQSQIGMVHGMVVLYPPAGVPL
jgi:hypothetical protein